MALPCGMEVPVVAKPNGVEAIHVEDSFEDLPTSSAPPEVLEALKGLQFPKMTACKLHKTSFHATYFLDFEGRIPGSTDEDVQDRVVLQLIGAQLGDKTFFHPARLISAAQMVKASQMIQAAGIRVPKIFATGLVETWGSLVSAPFVIYEFIKTETVEDEVIAPENEWRRIFKELKQKLDDHSLTDVDTEPLPHFGDCYIFIEHLVTIAKDSQADELESALLKVKAELLSKDVKAAPPRLIHQDLNDGNILCSPDPDGPPGSWKLDALIDFEGVVVGDPRVAFERAEPWSALRKLAYLTKMRWLSALVSGIAKLPQGGLPRCCSRELLEDYDEIGNELVRQGWLTQLKPLRTLENPVAGGYAAAAA